MLINIMLNAIFIYGAFGIESMNVRGAALATLISRVVAVSYTHLDVYKRQGLSRFRESFLYAQETSLF